MMSLWDALRMNMMISYQELVRTFPSIPKLKAVIALEWQPKSLEDWRRDVNGTLITLE